MCSFTYVAFALNRISLIGREHGKFVAYISEIAVKKYIGVSLFISASLSWIKYFKYRVNYFYPYWNYPMSNEMDIMLLSMDSTRFEDFYFTYNTISDLVNYLVFVVICIIIDICMVVQLRRTLSEKAMKSESMNSQNQKSKQAENDKAVNKAIKMVVLNTVIGVFFKLPILLIPLLNLCAQFYYKSRTYKYHYPSFDIFYSMLFDIGLYSLIQDMSHFLFTLSLSIQMFIYKRFDKKFRNGYEKIKDKVFRYNLPL